MTSLYVYDIHIVTSRSTFTVSHVLCGFAKVAETITQTFATGPLSKTKGSVTGSVNKTKQH